jgi:hypothetical protein
MKSRHENDQLRTQVSHLEKAARQHQLELLEAKEHANHHNFQHQRRHREARRFASEDDDFITEDNYLELNASTMSHQSVSTVSETRKERGLDLSTEEVHEDDDENEEDVEEEEEEGSVEDQKM